MEWKGDTGSQTAVVKPPHLSYGTGEAGQSERTVAVFPDWRDNPYLEQLARGLEPHGYRLVFSGRRWPVLPILSSLRSRGRTDLVHLHWQHSFIHGSSVLRTAAKAASFLVDIVGLRLMPVPVVWTVHNVVDHERSAPRLERLVGTVVARLVDRVVVHCSEARERVARSYRLGPGGREEVEVIPHPTYAGAYPPPPSRGAARDALGIGSGRFVYLHFGTLRRYKRLPFVVRQFEEAAPERALLLIAGPSVDEDVRRNVGELAAGADRVWLHARTIPDRQVPTYFAAADAFVYAGERVLMSGAVMLALNHGLPVVAPRTGCLPEVVPECGAVWYEPGSATELREALREVRRLASRRVRDRIRTAVSIFDPEAVGRRLAQLYGEVTA